MDNVNTMNTNVASIRGISGYSLKMIAVISMFIDHLGATVVLGYFYATRRITVVTLESDRLMDQLLVWGHDNWELVLSIYDTMRNIGRIAFPIYCFLIVEGFLHTKNVQKYAFRLGLFALISEIPFDLAFNDGWKDMSSNNVYFTLLIGLLVIWGISFIKEKCGLQSREVPMELSEEYEGRGGEKKQDILAKKGARIWHKLCGIITILACIGVGAFVAENILHTDYGDAGVLTIVVMYLLHKKSWMGYLMAVLVLTLMTNSTELIALLGAVLVCYYNGERGKNVKYFFYAFYPVHLLLLWLATYLLKF